MIQDYLFGLFGTDGHGRNDINGHLSNMILELTKKDEDIIYCIHNLFPDTSSIGTRTRDTNFKKDHQSTILYFNQKEILGILEKGGFPLKDKTNQIKPPLFDYNKYDFWRGVLDGDGSVGFRDEVPFISLTTKSEFLKESFVTFIFEETGKQLNPQRNKRDNIYNIMVTSTVATELAKKVWYDNCEIFLRRKFENAQLVKQWEKPNFKKRSWTNEEEEFLLNNSIENFRKEYPDRTILAIKRRLYTIKKRGEL